THVGAVDSLRGAVAVGDGELAGLAGDGRDPAPGFAGLAVGAGLPVLAVFAVFWFRRVFSWRSGDRERRQPGVALSSGLTGGTWHLGVFAVAPRFSGGSARAGHGYK